MRSPRTPSRRLPVTFSLLIGISVASALGLLALVTHDSLALTSDLLLAPLNTPASPPAENARARVTPQPSPVVAIAAAGLAPGLDLLAPVATASRPFIPVDELAITVEPAPAAPELAASAPTTYTLFVVVLMSGYTPPPRQPEPFVPLATYPGAWPAARNSLASSKISLHTVGPSEPGIMELVRRGKPRLIKAVGDYGWMHEVKAVSAEIVTLGRILLQQENWILARDPVEAADEYVQTNLREYQLNPWVDYWEGWNEFVPINAERMRWFAEFEAARACQMQALGFRAAVGGFSTGVPEYDLMDDFLPALEAAHRCGGLFHLHEYGSPTFNCLVQSNIPGLIPGAPALRVPAGPLTFRYRFWYEGHLKPAGLGDLPLVISELGIDGVLPSPACDDPGGTGWKGYTDWWVARGHGATGPQAYVNWLAWYDSELQHDYYVLGAAVFTTGATDAANGWYPFDLHDVLIPLTHYLTQRP
jgi:hypothetical protein